MTLFPIGSSNLFILERSTNLTTFVPLSLNSGSSSLAAANAEEIFRAHYLPIAVAQFLRKTAIADPHVAAGLVSWFDALRKLGLEDSVKFMASFLPEHVPGGATNLPSLVGPDVTASKALSWRDRGLVLDGSLTLALKNPLPSSVTQLSVFAVFASQPGNFGLLVGSDDGEGQAGPAVWVGGDAYMALDPENVAFTVTSNGKASGQAGFRIARTFNWGNRFAPQAILATAAPDKISIRTDIDREYAMPATNAVVANPNAEWRIGSRLGSTLPFVGQVYFVAVFDRALPAEILPILRESYQRTLGTQVSFPTTELVMEGDSLSEEAFGTEYGHWLNTASPWAGKFIKRNIARFGETTRQMLDEFGSEVPALYADQNYLFLWGGRNDLPNSSASDIFSRLAAYWSRGRAAGYKVVAFTIIPAGYEAVKTEVAAKRLELNALIRSASEQYDFLIDVDKVAALQNPKDQTFFLPDGVHLTAEGSKAVADLINATVVP